ncbi:MAG: hypothetical protein GF334_05445 [Candidatus Altiarchaeales archaeon]|nr:hypothetical protein [Candidatus Altiarchaeales archaeon]
MASVFTPIKRSVYERQGLLSKTIRIENIKNKYVDRGYFKHMRTMKQHGRFVGWYHVHGVPAGVLREGVKKLTELLGFPPVKHQSFAEMNAIYAFMWRDQPVLLFKSSCGVTLQVLPTFKAQDLDAFYKDLLRVLKV